METIKTLGGVYGFLDYLMVREWCLDWWGENSVEWKIARGKIFSALGNRCTHCGNPCHLHLHHVYGRNLDGERDGDINPIYLDPQACWEDIFEILCRGCHSGHHGKDLVEPVIASPARSRVFIPKPKEREPGSDDTGIDGPWPPQSWSLEKWCRDADGGDFHVRHTLTGIVPI